MKKEIKFPKILGLLILLLGLVVGVYMVGRKTIFRSKASGDCNPQNIQITNITDKSANISFITTTSCLSTIEVNNQIVNDLKLTLSGNPDQASKIHYFEVKYLKPQTSYDFTVLSGGITYTDSIYNFKTGSTPSKSTPNSNLAWGKVFNPDGKTPASAIVFVNIPGSQPLSSIVTTNGNWSVSLATSFNESKTDWFTIPTSAVTEDIVVISEDGSTTQLTNTTARNNPVPNIIIGKNSLEISEDEIQPEYGQLNGSDSAPVQKKVDIHNPKNGETINTSLPDFFGSAPNNSTVIIEVHSPEAINGQAVANNSGEWHWSPPKGLTPGRTYYNCQSPKQHHWALGNNHPLICSFGC